MVRASIEDMIAGGLIDIASLAFQNFWHRILGINKFPTTIEVSVDLYILVVANVGYETI